MELIEKHLERSDPNAFLLLQNRAKSLKNVRVMIQCRQTLYRAEAKRSAHQKWEDLGTS